MNMFNQTINGTQSNDVQGYVAKNFLANVFSWMGIALAMTAFTAYYFASDQTLISLLYNAQGGMTTLGMIVLFAPLALVLLMGFGMNKMSYLSLVLVFAIFSILMGMSLSFVLLVYTSASVFKTFLVTSLLFGVMAILGYTTKTDLTKFGSLLLMALIGIIIAAVVNFFMHSASLDYFISFFGVLIFTGLTAYDVQKLKRIGSGAEYQGASLSKLTVLGALSLYLDFINLFLFLLRFMGGRK